MPSVTIRAGAAVLGFALASGLSAQAAPKSGYGTADLQAVTLNHYAFRPINSTQTYSATCCGGDFYVNPTGGSPVFFAPIDASLIPNGARLERLDFFVRDSTATADFAGYLCRTWLDLDGADWDTDCSVVGLSSGTPGDTVVSIEPDLTIRYEANADGDAPAESISYVLVAQLGTPVPEYDANLRLRAVRMLYRRQVSPAPGAATFADVPTTHPFYQFIEALSASGITAGCGTDIYCPNAPLTRGQMAVFLAKALGLHWPAVSVP